MIVRGQSTLGKREIDPVSVLLVLVMVGLVALIPLGCLGILSW
jgi:hypothetical protein